MGTMNRKRAYWAGEALEVFVSFTGQDITHKAEEQEAIGDLLCNLLHLAKKAGVNNIAAFHDKAFRMYAEEVEDDE